MKLKPHGYIGLLIILAGEVLMLRKVEPFATYFTPIAWTGYVLFVDSLIFKLKGQSLMLSRTGEFTIMLPWSIACWLIFEAYNLHTRSWRYVGLPENIALRWLGYGWSFATIFPGILQTAELLETSGTFGRIAVRKRVITRRSLSWQIFAGVALLGIPVILPAKVAGYLIGLVWVGFIFLLEPINYLLGGRSILRQLEEGKLDKLLYLFASGLVCGFLWEFWNYWARAKWEYTFPFQTGPKVFEMPILGFLGFLPFAVECYSMQNFLMAWGAKLRRSYRLQAEGEG